MVATAALTLLLGGSSCLEGGSPVTCNANCDIEAECEFRSLEACQAASCNPVTGALVSPGIDSCLASAPGCLEAAACACDDGCAKVDECAENPDPSCVETCDTLVEQQPKATYIENFCRAAADCDDVAGCGSVN